jgi:hypothetical protein
MVGKSRKRKGMKRVKRMKVPDGILGARTPENGNSNRWKKLPESEIVRRS